MGQSFCNSAHWVCSCPSKDSVVGSAPKVNQRISLNKHRPSQVGDMLRNLHLTSHQMMFAYRLPQKKLATHPNAWVNKEDNTSKIKNKHKRGKQTNKTTPAPGPKHVQHVLSKPRVRPHSNNTSKQYDSWYTCHQRMNWKQWLYAVIFTLSFQGLGF